MEMQGSVVIPAPRQAVWDALNDPEVLKQSIPGCQSINQISPTEIDASVRAKVGPVSATFQGKVTLSDLDPPNGYTISGEGKGGAAGFAKGGAKVKLTDEAEGTRLTYDVSATVGGKLAQIGSRLIDQTSKKLADEFFQNFSRNVGAAQPESAESAAAEAAAAPSPAPSATPSPAPKPAEKGGLSPWIWIPVLVAVIGAILWYYSSH
jgi:carbon monoxide dehydrogenase subunit G